MVYPDNQFPRWCPRQPGFRVFYYDSEDFYLDYFIENTMCYGLKVNKKKQFGRFREVKLPGRSLQIPETGIKFNAGFTVKPSGFF
jgi:hypothetical protein